VENPSKAIAHTLNNHLGIYQGLANCHCAPTPESSSPSIQAYILLIVIDRTHTITTCAYNPYALRQTSIPDDESVHDSAARHQRDRRSGPRPVQSPFPSLSFSLFIDSLRLQHDPAMPSLLSPATGAGSRSYTPLADEVNPPFGNHAPAVTRNGTVVYGKRASLVSDTTPDPHSLVENEHARYHGNGDSNGVVPIYRSGSNETLTTMSTVTASSLKGKERAVMQVQVPEDEDGDIGELRRGGTLRANAYGHPNGGAVNRKGKGKERAWDAEMGPQEAVQESYPPGNEALDEERRVQDVSITVK